jgi:hypothetical protein
MLDDLLDWFFGSGWKIAALLLAAFAAARILRRILRGPPSDPYRLWMHCRCGWTGTVSRYHPACPRCGARLT